MKHAMQKRACHFLMAGTLLLPFTAIAQTNSLTPVPAETHQAASSIQPMHSARLWNLQDADILSVINEVSQETGKNFAIDPRVNGKITLVSSKPLKQDEVYQVFLSVLGMLGYSAIPSGEVIKIVPNMESGEQATPVLTEKDVGQGDEVVVKVIGLQNTSAAQLMSVIRPLLPQWSNVSAYTPSNIIILLGRAANLERIEKIIHDVDIAANNSIQVVPIKHASATQIAHVLNNLQQGSRVVGEAPAITIAVDERSNSILLSGTKNARLRMRVLISQLDEPAATPAGNTEVVYLRYLEAKTFAPVLSKIASNIMGKDTGSSFGGGAYQTTNSTTSNAQTSTNSSTAPTNEPINSSNIQPEVNTNAVIITAPPALMTALKSVIAKLDIRPAQVMVEAIIAEIDETNLTSLGVQWGSMQASEGNIPISGDTASAFPKLGAGIVGVIPSIQIQAVLSLLRNQNGVDILSTPSVMVLDNQKATIEIGQKVPTQNGSYATTGNATTATPYNTTDWKDVTLKLEVTPQINLGTSVRLKLNLKNDTLQNPQNPGLTPLINTSSIQNTTIIHDNDVLVLGGLMSHANNENVNKVPLLGDIPIVGKLFTQKTTSQQKKSLVVFIKPIIVHNDADSTAITETKYSRIRSTQANFRDDLRTIGDKPLSTKLPVWNKKRELPAPFAKG